MVSKKTKKRDVEKKDDKILYAFLATFLSIIGFIIAIAVKRKDKYVMYYAKQSLVIFVIGAVLGVVTKIIAIIPLMGEIIKVASGVLVFVIWLMSWLYSLTGTQRDIPIVSDLAEKINL